MNRLSDDRRWRRHLTKCIGQQLCMRQHSLVPGGSLKMSIFFSDLVCASCEDDNVILCVCACECLPSVALEMASKMVLIHSSCDDGPKDIIITIMNDDLWLIHFAFVGMLFETLRLGMRMIEKRWHFRKWQTNNHLTLEISHTIFLSRRAQQLSNNSCNITAIHVKYNSLHTHTTCLALYPHVHFTFLHS